MTIRAVWALLAACAVAWSWPALGQNQGQGQKAAGPLTLQQALQRAANANPRIAVADRNIGMADGRREQANALPNPTVGVEVDNFGQGQSSFTGTPEMTLMLSQLIELGGKRGARVQAAMGDYDASRWEREAARLELLSETTIAFVEALSVQRRIQLLERQAGALEKLVPLMQRRVEAGASSPSEVSRTQAAVGLVRFERERGRTALAVARRDLAALMSLDQPNFATVAGDYGRLVKPAPLDTLIRAIEDNPQLMRWSAIRAQRDGELLSARLKPLPDITASVAWRHYTETNDNGVRFGVSIPINVIDRNKGAIREAQESVQKTGAERAVNRLLLIAIIGKAHDTANGTLQQLDLLRKTILPAARASLKTIEEGYGQGRFTLLEILDAYRTVADAELLEHEALASFHTSIATIEGLIGSPANQGRPR
jgi:cobalt-zinc-cadmium efflux system outer membrane protein